MNLIVDYGNSSAKVAIFNHLQLIEKHSFKTADELQLFLQQSTCENFIVSSVNTDAVEVSRWAVHAKKKFILSHSLPLPIKIAYRTPQTLGVDRIAGVCGALQLFPGKSSLVVDTGTCITYDFIDQEGIFQGGGISPGLMMRFQAVHTFTARLPLVNPTDAAELIGVSTENAIQSGIINGLVAEIDGIITRYKDKYPDLQSILFGGDSYFFLKKFKSYLFASPDLVLLGLNSVLIHNVSG
jgi:type III pantothenate kinase